MYRSPHRSRTLLAAALISCLTTSGCFCTLLPCTGGFAWHAVPLTGDVEPGLYRFTVTLEDSETFELACEITATSSDCDRWRDSETSAYEVSLDFDLPFGEAPNSQTLDGFFVSAQAYDGNNTIGPRRVSIEVTHDDAPLASADYDLEYVRDDQLNGGPHCGFCDQVEIRDYAW